MTNNIIEGGKVKKYLKATKHFTVNRGLSLVKYTSDNFMETVTINFRNKIVDAKSLLGITSLGILENDKFSLNYAKEDEIAAVELLNRLDFLTDDCK